jgi:hypothetical protein
VSFPLLLSTLYLLEHSMSPLLCLLRQLPSIFSSRFLYAIFFSWTIFHDFQTALR